MERLRFAHTWRPAIQKITELPFQAALELPASVPSFVRSRMRARTAESPFTLSDIKGAAATILIAGNDTTSSTLNLLVLYLLQNPGAHASH